MFNYRLDKVGFFSTLVLATVFIATVVATLVLVILGIWVGDWDTFAPWVKFTIGLGWVLCIGTVLVRVYTYHYRRQRMLREQQAAEMEVKNLNGEPGTNGAAHLPVELPHPSGDKA